MHRFGDIIDVCAPELTPISFYFGGVFVRSDIAHFGVSPGINLKLISREVIARSIPMYVKQFAKVTGRQTVRRHAIALRRFAVCTNASQPHGKNTVL